MKRASLLTAAFFLATSLGAAQAETLTEALSAAYNNNPTLNAARASTRATDERVPQALSGYRPTVSGFATMGVTGIDNTTTRDGARSITTGITLTQPIFRGFRTENGVKAAEAAVRAARESLRNTEQNVLLDAATAYMNVVRDQQILQLRQADVRFLREQVRATSDRLQVGEGTRTDVAQSEARLASAQSDVAVAQASLEASIGTYQQVIGRQPKNLKSAKAVGTLLPPSLDRAVALSRTSHPAILATQFNADVAAYNVNVIEGELLPTLSLEATAQRDWEDGFGANTGNSASVVGRLNIPIYEGGAVYSRVREAKETLGQRRIEVDAARDEVLAALIAAWGGLEAAKAQVSAARSQVGAARLALEGVQEEQRVGQRTTLDVLDAQAEVTRAQITLVVAERDAVVASYSVLAAIGRLSAETLNLKVAAYKPEHHYEQVRDKWFGLRTPSGQ